VRLIGRRIVVAAHRAGIAAFTRGRCTKERRTDCIEIPADINPHILLHVFVECEGELDRTA